MSWPVTSFYCTSCNFEQGDAPSWGRREYLLGDGSNASVQWVLGWCEDCRGLAAVEVLSEVQRRTTFEKAAKNLAALGYRPSLRWWELHWFLFPAWRQKKVDEWTRSASVSREARAALRLILDRKTPPRCLRCGGQRVFAPLVADESEWSDRSQPKGTGSLHPRCGGELWMKSADMRFAYRPSVQRYTPEGEFIGREYEEE